MCIEKAFITTCINSPLTVPVAFISTFSLYYLFSVVKIVKILNLYLNTVATVGKEEQTLAQSQILQ